MEINFNVTFTLSGKINRNDDELMEMAKNIATALERQAENAELSPNGCDEYVTHIHVTPQYLNTPVIVNLG